VVLRRFADPAPHRDIALIWRRSTAYPDLLHDIAAVLRDLPVPVLTPLG
jgi:LysR family hydrogen peroxide-inducible transcriptional activator